MACLNKTALLAGVQQLALARLAALVQLNATPQHTNTDGTYTPAEWWYDTAYTTRYRLQTAAAMSMSGNTLTVSLTYTILDA